MNLEFKLNDLSIFLLFRGFFFKKSYKFLSDRSYYLLDPIDYACTLSKISNTIFAFKTFIKLYNDNF